MNNVKEAIRLNEIIKSAASDPFKAYVAQIDQERLEEIQKENLQKMFTEARRFGLKYIYISKYEMCGCEGKPDDSGTWPAVWSIARSIGFYSGGNSDQYHCPGAEIAFPSDSLGGWDLTTETKLTEEQCDNKNFRRVVEHFRGKQK